MAEPKVFFHSNIRFLRERVHKTQEILADELGISRNKLQALESAKTVNPIVKDLIQFSEYFKISIDSLLKVDLSKLGELKLRELLAGNDVYMTGSKIRVLAITVDKNEKENIEYVPLKAKAGYFSGYKDPEYIASLPKFSMPNLPAQRTFRMFSTSGDSMLPIPENSDIICSYVEDWTSLKPDTACVLILKEQQDLVFKMVTLQKNGTFWLRSLNSSHAPYTVEVSSVLEVWKFYSFHSKKIPSGSNEIEELKSLILDLSRKINKS